MTDVVIESTNSASGVDGSATLQMQVPTGTTPYTPPTGRWWHYFRENLGLYALGGDAVERLMSISTIKTFVASGYTALPSDFAITVNAAGGTATLNLPSAAAYKGKQYVISKYDSSANAVVVTRAGSDTIEGATTKSITVQNQTVWIQSDGVSDWVILGERNPLSLNGGRPITSVATSTGLGATHDVVLVTATATITLPTAVGIAGKTYCVKSNADAITVTIATTSAQTVDGAASGADDLKLTQRYQSIDMISNGANWMILGRML